MKSITYKKGFFALLGVFLVFLLWILVSDANYATPRNFLRSLFTRYKTPTNIVEEMKYDNGSFTVKLVKDMDTTFSELCDYSIYTDTETFDYSDISWVDSRTFKLQLSRPLTENESFMVKYLLKDTEKGIINLVEIKND